MLWLYTHTLGKDNAAHLAIVQSYCLKAAQHSVSSVYHGGEHLNYRLADGGLPAAVEELPGPPTAAATGVKYAFH